MLTNKITKNFMYTLQTIMYRHCIVHHSKAKLQLSAQRLHSLLVTLKDNDFKEFIYRV